MSHEQGIGTIHQPTDKSAETKASAGAGCALWACVYTPNGKQTDSLSVGKGRETPLPDFAEHTAFSRNVAAAPAAPSEAARKEVANAVPKAGSNAGEIAMGNIFEEVHSTNKHLASLQPKEIRKS